MNARTNVGSPIIIIATISDFLLLENRLRYQRPRNWENVFPSVFSALMNPIWNAVAPRATNSVFVETERASPNFPVSEDVNPCLKNFGFLAPMCIIILCIIKIFCFWI